MAIIKSLKADISIVSSLSERLEEILCFVWVYAEDGTIVLVGIWWWENKNKFSWMNECSGIESDNLKDKCLFSSLTAFLTVYKEYLPILLLNEDLFCQL